ncbi:hypothetical protein AMATHDRAFT_2451 [Amanita thiersii Skay4041]|uniref:Calcineurin-like phosphoesterase domain-containing protein n=1 Tax=Amanita thiersii Skay4041 TaxID=703135 RepID=A0A2A9NNU2_9AGAR|nr:hypothetical protein AMATHDRAFT_2451 [Amanita thiersii Skay4041]
MFVAGLTSLVLLGLINVNFACDDHSHDHGHHARRATPSVQLAPPSRPLEWGDINIIHTTDTHGWLLGHQKASFPEPNYSGDFGDFASFVSHMKNIAHKGGVDLLLVDSGDLHDGTGLVDGFPQGGVDAHDANEFFKMLPYDVLAIGNHELYIYANALDMHKNFAPRFNGRYLSSNVNITVADKHGNLVDVPVGSRFAKFKTTHGRRVTALGVLYDFTDNDRNTTVQKVEDMVKERWFAEAIQEEPDLFLLAGHMPVANDNWPAVFNAVRAVHPHTPIIILGGHTHIRDCVQFDSRSMALESGRYLETLGWMSMKLDKKGSTNDLQFSRRYLDPNRVTYEYHTQTSDMKFDTPQGSKITRGLQTLSEKFNLSLKFGTAPRDLTLQQSPYPSDGSLLTEFIEKAVPTALAVNNTRANIPNIIITNSGSQRFDIYTGAFTRNDQFTVSPFTDAFLFIPNVPLSAASKVLPALNDAGSNQRRTIEELEKREKEMYARGEVEHRYRAWLESMSKRGEAMDAKAENLTLGYVTQDSCPGVGDDTLHKPLTFFNVPDFIGSKTPDVPDDTPIDLVFVDFIGSQLLEILNSVQTDKQYTQSDVAQYSPILANAVWGIYAQAAWN